MCITAVTLTKRPFDDIATTSYMYNRFRLHIGQNTDRCSGIGAAGSICVVTSAAARQLIMMMTTGGRGTVPARLRAVLLLVLCTLYLQEAAGADRKVRRCGQTPPSAATSAKVLPESACVACTVIAESQDGRFIGSHSVFFGLRSYGAQAACECEQGISWQRVEGRKRKSDSILASPECCHSD